jgi:hypothetical protein
MGLKIGLKHQGKNTDWGYLRTAYWGASELVLSVKYNQYNLTFVRHTGNEGFCTNSKNSILPHTSCCDAHSNLGGGTHAALWWRDTHPIPWWLTCKCLSLCQLVTMLMEISFWNLIFLWFPARITVLCWLHTGATTVILQTSSSQIGHIPLAKNYENTYQQGKSPP